uniref:Uncharacterized protein n=1 Tax=Panagrellus redivivus TaxID=6233 RepID=A0A7E4VYV6_PANRE
MYRIWAGPQRSDKQNDFDRCQTAMLRQPACLPRPSRSNPKARPKRKVDDSALQGNGDRDRPRHRRAVQPTAALCDCVLVPPVSSSRHTHSPRLTRQHRILPKEPSEKRKQKRNLEKQGEKAEKVSKSSKASSCARSSLTVSLPVPPRSRQAAIVRGKRPRSQSVLLMMTA